MSSRIGTSRELRTERLLLRPWRDSDLDAFAQMSADPVVMEYFPATLTRAESDALAARLREDFEARGHGVYALELPGRAAFIGFTGLKVADFPSHFTPCTEIAWRLAREHWGAGYVTEAAQAVLEHAFTQLKLAEVVSFTAVRNVRSQRVMERLGMRRDLHGDFAHPALPAGHPLAPHVLYRLPAR